MARDMPRFGPRSTANLMTCHQGIIRVCTETIKLIDFSVVSGYRTEEEQNSLYNRGYSQLRYPHSKHNKKPSQAFDVALWHKSEPHIRWDNKDEFIFLAGFIMANAERFGVPLRWGGNWDGCWDTQNNFNDLGHFELI